MNSAYLFVAGTVILTVYGQLVVKWQAGKFGEFPSDGGDRLRYLGDYFTNPWVISVFVLTLLGAICWVAALSRLDLSRAYPFIAASFVLVLFLSALFFDEPVTLAKVAGALLIVAGLVVGSQS